MKNTAANLAKHIEVSDVSPASSATNSRTNSTLSTPASTTSNTCNDDSTFMIDMNTSGVETINENVQMEVQLKKMDTKNDNLKIETKQTKVSESALQLLNIPTTVLAGLQDIPWATARFLVTHNTFWCRILHFPAEILINYSAYMFLLSALVIIGSFAGLFGVFFVGGLILNAMIAVTFTVQAFCSGSYRITMLFFMYHSSCVIVSYYWIGTLANPMVVGFYWTIGVPFVVGMLAASWNAFVAHKVFTGDFPISQEPEWMPIYFDFAFGAFSVPFFDFMSFVYEYGWFGVSEFDQKKCHVLSMHYKAIACFGCQRKAANVMHLDSVSQNQVAEPV